MAEIVLEVGVYDDRNTPRGYQMPYNWLNAIEGDTVTWKMPAGTTDSFQVLFNQVDWPFQENYQQTITPGPTGATSAFRLRRGLTISGYTIKLKLQEEFAHIEPVIIIDPQVAPPPGLLNVVLRNPVIVVIAALVGFGIGFAVGAAMG